MSNTAKANVNDNLRDSFLIRESRLYLRAKGYRSNRIGCSRRPVRSIWRTETYWQDGLRSSITRGHGQTGGRTFTPLKWGSDVGRDDTNSRVVAMLVYNGKDGTMLGVDNSLHSCNDYPSFEIC